MKNTSMRFATHTALGAALALAISLTTAVSPASAETRRPGITPSNPIATLPDPAPTTSSVTFLPDVRVNYIGKSTGSGGKVTYRFRVQNIGIGTATNVGLSKAAGQLSNDGSVGTYQTWSGGTIASLGQDQQQEVTVVCTPLPGYRCDGGSLKALVTNDLDPSNNTAHS